MTRNRKPIGGALGRRQFLQASAMAGAGLATLGRAARAQTKPEKLVFVGDNGPWHGVLVNEVGPAFEKETGIKVEYNLLPYDALGARLRAELDSGSSGIDIVQWTPQMKGWLAPHLEDHEALLAKAADKNPDYDWSDFLPAAKNLASSDGRLIGIPYRVTVAVIHYQKYLLDQVGITKPPGTFAELQEAAIATTKAGAPDRYGLGIWGRQAQAIFSGFYPWLLSNGGKLYDPKTWDIHINDEPAVSALQWYGDLVTKYKVVPPEAMTWEWDGIVSGGQNDRYAMSLMHSSYGTLVNNDPKKSKTAGKWAWTTVPGAKSPEEGRTWISGWAFSVPTTTKNKDWAFEFIQFATSKTWLQRSMDSGNSPPRASVLNAPEVQKKFGWAPASATALKTAVLEPADAIWPTLEVQLRPALSQVLLGQTDAKSALDGVAADWQRSMRRAGLIAR